MKKNGFTLIELLIVMVLVGTLVTIALPKYQRALERGRALEGLRNVQYAAEYAAAKYMATGSYPSSLPNTDQIKSKFFSAPSINSTTGAVTISRTGGDWSYSFTATNNGEGTVTSIVCSGTACSELDMGDGNLLTRK